MADGVELGGRLPNIYNLTEFSEAEDYLSDLVRELEFLQIENDLSIKTLNEAEKLISNVITSAVANAPRGAGIIYADASVTNSTIYLPLPTSAKDEVFYIKKISTGVKTVTVKVLNSAANIDENTGYILTGSTYPCIKVHCDGNNYWVI